MAGPYILPSRSLVLNLFFLISLSHALYISPRVQRLAANFDPGTSNVCKAQVANFPTFPTLSIRKNRPCGTSTPWYPYTLGEDTTAKTGVSKTSPPWFTLGQRAKFSWPADVTCEHILELNILQYVMESAHGPCDQIANELANGRAFDDPQVTRHWKPLYTIINGPDNLSFAPTKTLEEQKALVVQYARANNVGNVQVPGITAADAPHLLKATNSYLKLTKDGTDTTLLHRQWTDMFPPAEHDVSDTY
ncbi:hypothetical protein DFH06DRAFT_1247871 [Mycena polygramma]|nr:hypothetical protein DFH06DRAFT_1247871 [Mycena polygramma]